MVRRKINRWRHFLQKHTFENFLTFINLFIRPLKKQISIRNEDQRVCKIQEFTDTFETAKFTLLKMRYSIVVIIYNLLPVMHRDLYCNWNDESAYYRIVKLHNSRIS